MLQNYKQAQIKQDAKLARQPIKRIPLRVVRSVVSIFAPINNCSNTSIHAATLRGIHTEN